ncbi:MULTISPECIES: hypothetical protein [Halorussus]|uniref:hypothetical protein n=1 Tax=Halorussus TaxID=1070314 RepID=UPI00209F13EF|nr:hypothetical protein [Halorussus vallis]USZ78071.1 hypothetical protein NGM07_20630 [Halorussus vallis]
MSNENAAGVAPLVAGLAYLGTSLDSTARALRGGIGSVSDVAALAGVVGSLAAIAVGVGILLGWRSFEPAERAERADGSTATVALVSIAVVSFVLGAVVAVL